MVRAILDGRKTTTRRVIKPQPDRYFEVHESPIYLYDVEFGKGIINPPYQPGDILYVRETWQKFGRCYIFKADENSVTWWRDQNIGKWHPSIHMPKEAARIFLCVTDVKAERLQNITDEEAEKEGCNDATSTAMGFSYVWDSTIKKSDLNKYGWGASPWVWVISFERCKKP